MQILAHHVNKGLGMPRILALSHLTLANRENRFQVRYPRVFAWMRPSHALAVGKSVGGKMVRIKCYIVQWWSSNGPGWSGLHWSDALSVLPASYHLVLLIAPHSPLMLRVELLRAAQHIHPVVAFFLFKLDIWHVSIVCLP